MANKRITELTDIGTPASSDVLEIVDVSDTTDSPEGTSKKVLVSALGGGGGAVTSVNGQTGVVSIDLQSVLTEGNRQIKDLTDYAPYTFILGDETKYCIDIDNEDKTIPDSVFSVGDELVVYNDGGIACNILTSGDDAFRLGGASVTTFSLEVGYLAIIKKTSADFWNVNIIPYSVSSGGVSDGDKGDITVSSAGTVWTIDNGLDATKLADGSVTNTELQYINSLTSNAQTQLDAKADKSTSAYSIKANNTNATANETELVYKSTGLQSYTDTITFTAGTAPSGTENKSYNSRQIGNWIEILFNFDYSVSGATVTQLVFPLPSGLPDPVVPTGFSGASVALYSGTGTGANALTGVGVSASDIPFFIRRNSADTAFEFVLSLVSSSYRTFRANIQYPIS